jgi:GntR family transcriptional regulator
VRQLAADLRVNPATVVQAYRDLETEGFVEMRQGAGTFVREVATERRARERTRVARQLVRALVADAARAGIPVADLIAAIENELGAKTP